MTNGLGAAANRQLLRFAGPSDDLRHSRPRERLKGAESVGNPCLSEDDIGTFSCKSATGIGECHKDTPGAELARQIGATGHAVFTLARGAHGRELTCLHRANFPELPPAPAARLADSAVNSIRPFWWAEQAECSLEGLRWAWRLQASLPGPVGVAFPVPAERKATGLVVFLGTRLSLSDRNLPELHRRCFDLFATVAAEAARPLRKTPSLAQRERECIRLAADGLTSEEIAAALGLSLHTANQYLAAAARKLNANGRMHAVAKALRLGLID